MIRPSFSVLVICPNDGEVRFEFGLSNCGWLNALINSVRMSSVLV